jgi:hypothetical protein
MGVNDVFNENQIIGNSKKFQKFVLLKLRTSTLQFAIYLTTPSVTQTIASNIWITLNNERERTWKKSVLD